jgi:TM2 domain-containing membrane protein YozV
MSNKSNLVTLILCFFFGGLGFHRFYVGKIVSGLLMIGLLSIGVFFKGLISLLFVVLWIVWYLYDFFRIIFGAFTDEDGNQITWTN